MLGRGIAESEDGRREGKVEMVVSSSSSTQSATTFLDTDVDKPYRCSHLKTQRRFCCSSLAAWTSSWMHFDMRTLPPLLCTKSLISMLGS